MKRKTALGSVRKEWEIKANLRPEYHGIPPRVSSLAAKHHYDKDEHLHKVLHQIANPHLCKPADRLRAFPNPDDGPREITTVKWQTQGNASVYNVGVPILPMNLFFPLGAIAGSSLGNYATAVNSGNTGAESGYTYGTLGGLTGPAGAANTVSAARITGLSFTMKFTGPPSTAVGRVHVMKVPRLGAGGIFAGLDAKYWLDFDNVVGNNNAMQYVDTYSVSEIYQKGGLTIRWAPTTDIELKLLNNKVNVAVNGPLAATTSIVDPETGLDINPVNLGSQLIPWAKIWFSQCQSTEQIAFQWHVIYDVTADGVYQFDSTLHNPTFSTGSIPPKHPGFKEAVHGLGQAMMTGAKGPGMKGFTPGVSDGQAATAASLEHAKVVGSKVIGKKPMKYASIYQKLKALDRSARTEVARWADAFGGLRNSYKNIVGAGPSSSRQRAPPASIKTFGGARLPPDIAAAARAKTRRGTYDRFRFSDRRTFS